MEPSVSGAIRDPSFWKNMGSNSIDVLRSLSNFGGAVGQSVKQGSFGPVIGSIGDGIGPAIDHLMQPANRASAASKDVFPKQDWDNTQRNALRHSLWVGGMAKAMGAGPDSPVLTPLAQTAAKGFGYLHEGISNTHDMFTGQTRPIAHARDTRHDLNNNAVGAEMAGYARDDQELLRALSNMAVTARAGKPVGMDAMSDGRLSYDPDYRAPARQVQVSNRR